MRIGEQASAKKLGIEREALRMRAMRRMGFDELVVEGKSRIRYTIEHLVCIAYVGDFYKFGDQIGGICANLYSENVELFQLVHARDRTL